MLLHITHKLLKMIVVTPVYATQLHTKLILLLPHGLLPVNNFSMQTALIIAADRTQPL